MNGKKIKDEWVYGNYETFIGNAFDKETSNPIKVRSKQSDKVSAIVYKG